MFDGGSDDVIALAYKAENREVIGFCAAAGEDDFRCAASQQGCYRLARAFYRSSRLLAVVVNRRGIPETLTEVRLHRLKDFGKHGRWALLSVKPAAWNL